MVNWLLVGKLAYDCTLAVTCTIAICAGGKYERIGAAVAVGASGVTVFVLPASRLIGAPAHYGFIVVNVITLLAFDQIMIRSRRWWPIVAVGFQLASVAIDIAGVLSVGAARNYLWIQGKFAYPILIALAVGSVRYRLRRRRTMSPGAASV